MLTQRLTEVIVRELRALIREVRAFPDDDALWQTPRGVSNSAGNLALHLSGNIQHYIGAKERKDWLPLCSRPHFGKPAPKFKIQTPPFDVYAAWATPVLHDTRAGLRINARCQVQDLNGQVTAGLYCGGESAGGFSQHGLARCAVQGLIAGRNAATEKPAV